LVNLSQEIIPKFDLLHQREVHKSWYNLIAISNQGFPCFLRYTS
jgi:hypothetical protein